jgi:formamidopyrimidine-DNA glycosylase
VRGIRQQLVGRKILTFETDWDRALKSPSPEEFKAQIVGQTIKAVERRAKFIVIKLSKQTLVIHLRMSGAYRNAVVGFF